MFLKPGDLVTVDADGCVQTGGSNDSWKRYVDPRGDNLLYGALGLTGATKADGTALPNPTHIQDVRLQPLRISVPQNLQLGYVGSSNDVYGNNGYWAHDNGSPVQCDLADMSHFGGNAFVTIQIQHAAPGDLNWDGKVDCSDLAIVKASFGKKTGQTGFDPRADANGDGVVDVKDLAFVALKLPKGLTCP